MVGGVDASAFAGVTNSDGLSFVRGVEAAHGRRGRREPTAVAINRVALLPAWVPAVGAGGRLLGYFQAPLVGSSPAE